MPQDLSSEVKNFLMSYPSTNQLTILAKDEMTKVYGLLETEVANQDWFSTIEYDSAISWKWLQIWNREWHPTYNAKIPWIHFEYTFSWSDQLVQASVDIEPVTTQSQALVKPLVDELYNILLNDKPPILSGCGWLLRPKLEDHRMLLVKRKKIIKEEFSAEWILQTGLELFNELSNIIPQVDKAISAVFE
jgi:hypothetical protein